MNKTKHTQKKRMCHETFALAEIQKDYTLCPFFSVLVVPSRLLCALQFTAIQFQWRNQKHSTSQNQQNREWKKIQINTFTNTIVNMNLIITRMREARALERECSSERQRKSELKKRQGNINWIMDQDFNHHPLAAWPLCTLRVHKINTQRKRKQQ